MLFQRLKKGLNKKVTDDLRKLKFSYVSQYLRNYCKYLKFENMYIVNEMFR